MLPLERCVNCGYSLKGHYGGTRCSECGFPIKLCSHCGDSIDELACSTCSKPFAAANEATLLFGYLFPTGIRWNGFWWQDCSNGAIQLIEIALWVIAIPIFALSVLLASTGTHVVWHRACIACDGTVIWSWRANTNTAHWAKALHDLDRDGQIGALSEIYADGAVKRVSLFAHPECTSPLHTLQEYRGNKAFTLNFSRATAVLCVVLLMPSLAMWVLLRVAIFFVARKRVHENISKNMIRRALCRLRWGIPYSIMLQGCFILILAFSDAMLPWTGFIYLGTATIGIEILLPVLVMHLLIECAVRSDFRHRVLKRRRTHPLAGIGIIVIAMIGISHLINQAI